MKKVSQRLLDENTIYQVITGSTAYGLEVKDSDLDQKAIVILPIQHTLQLEKEWETTTLHNPDIEYHSLKKTMRLLQAQNPTILETLFVDESHIVKSTSFGNHLRNNRETFLTKTCYYTFGGYAKDQLMRMKQGLNQTTSSDIVEHLLHKLEHIIRNATDRYPSLKNGKFHLYAVENDLKCCISFEQIPLTELFGITSELSNTVKSVQSRKQNNIQSEHKLHKQAMHLIRLLLMGIEILTERTLTVLQRHDNQDLLLSIRHGELSWENIFLLTERLFLQLENAFQNSPLPEKVNHNAVDSLFYEIMKNYYGIK
ncbi:DNA polymerase beta superfamily protein [Salirhabdus sp. Marseille-P4669]|uniref:DNA polymerase beta superfamily protein n=1 Tax=Salirhabdus sp. Marseille-P4669 TaxID=2042310 RepID=UPI00135CDF44|nr:nucleotidyltransferase domain-containing protein [Salirhabdus sp. Marseille-P4669]